MKKIILIYLILILNFKIIKSNFIKRILCCYKLKKRNKINKNSLKSKTDFSTDKNSTQTTPTNINNPSLSSSSFNFNPVKEPSSTNSSFNYNPCSEFNSTKNLP